MLFVERSNCFETNSSSMHSVVITTRDEMTTEKEIREELNHKNKVKFYESDMHYGRSPFNVLTSWYDKLSYLLTSANQNSSLESPEYYMHIVFEYIEPKVPEFEGFELDTEIVEEFKYPDGRIFPIEERPFYDRKSREYYSFDGKTKVVLEPTGNAYEVDQYGSIDHESSCLMYQFFLEKQVSVLDFIFNKSYVVIIDGDEYGIFDKMKQEKLIDTKIIKEEYPK